ncbi:hypothetical protein BCR33DRAFT_714088 [Rhizoclosmatium globosum]|uniref:Uncharacterized protein n=1 Tax=Rhizoclosmatium globosum TaxID=329046 RepID=A0A1Y2CPQ0_9FUNG|nr:hypothetical protein BCR33DRAFT_714088 [Rhizoclosmatium globosum]|eukprot:ORY49010.1 hypothetical protein BCR33DRAFT_714088 [Rhizoclosmatium globosum]
MLGDYIVDFFSQNGLRIDPTDLEENLIDFFADPSNNGAASQSRRVRAEGEEDDDDTVMMILKMECRIMERQVGAGRQGIWKWTSAATPAPRQEPIIDEDGFELVQQKGRRRR